MLFCGTELECGLLDASSFRLAAAGHRSPRLLGFSLLATFGSPLSKAPVEDLFFGLKLFYVFISLCTICNCYREEPLLIICLNKWRLLFVYRSFLELHTL